MQHIVIHKKKDLNGMVMQCELKPNELSSIISSTPYMCTVWKLCNLQLKLIQKVILWMHWMKHYYNCKLCQLSLQNHLPIDINSRSGYTSTITITWNILYNVNFSLQVNPSDTSLTKENQFIFEWNILY